MLQILGELFFKLILHGVGAFIGGTAEHIDKRTDGRYSGCFLVAVATFLALLTGFLIYAVIRAIV